MAARRSLALAKSGYELMDKKRNILVREMMGLLNTAAEIQAKIDATFSMAYSALQNANITLGIISEINRSVPEDNDVSIRYRSVMGVELPSVREREDIIRPQYGFFESNSMLDEAYRRFHEVKRLTERLAEVEISIYRLAYTIKKTQKRANALSNIIIPDLNESILRISDALEEKEREEFVRLKVIKARK